MTPEALTAIGIVLAALCGIIPSTYAIYQARKKVVIEEKDLEDQITERVLKRANVELERLAEENSVLRAEMNALRSASREKDEITSQENEALQARVKELEASYKTLQAKYEELLEKYNEVCGIVDAKDRHIDALTGQLLEIGMEPACGGD